MQPNYAALSASDGSGEPVLIVLTANRAIGSTTLTGNTPTNWPTGTYIATTGTVQSDGTLNPTTAQVFYGTVSGGNLTITAFAAGYSDLGNSIGDVVVIKPTTEWANIVAQGVQSTTLFPDQFANFVEPAGGVWSTSSGLVGSQTAGNVWYNGVRSVIPVVTTHTFTASKDTYVDFNPATNTFTYVPVTNGATEPAVTASNVRVAKVVTGSSAVTTISQTQYTSPRTGAIPYNPYKFSVYRGNSWTSANGTVGLVTFDTEVFDTGSNYSISTGKFTAPISGFYQFSWQVSAAVTSGGLFFSRLARNSLSSGGNAWDGSGSVQGGATTSGYSSGAVLVYATAGDYFQIFFYGTGGAGGENLDTYFSGFLMSEN